MCGHGVTDLDGADRIAVVDPRECVGGVGCGNDVELVTRRSWIPSISGAVTDGDPTTTIGA